MRRIATTGETDRRVRFYCRVPGCTDERRRDDLICRAHWQLCPRPLRFAVLRAFDAGPGSPSHLRACAFAIRAVQRISAADPRQLEALR